MDASCHSATMEGLASLDLLLVFLTGLTISLGHCLGMCGPIQAAFSMQQNQGKGRGLRLLPPLLRYHLGRVFSYTVIGAVFALIGSATRLSPAAVSLQGYLALGAGALMAMAAVTLLGLAPSANWHLPDAWGRPAARWIGRLLTAPGAGKQLLLGVANGFLPCGPVLAVALSAAAAARVGFGALLMISYGLGTLPVLLTFGLLSSRLEPELRRRFYRAGAALVLLLGLQLILRGLAALSVLAHFKLGPVVFW